MKTFKVRYGEYRGKNAVEKDFSFSNTASPSEVKRKIYASFPTDTAHVIWVKFEDEKIYESESWKKAGAYKKAFPGYK